MKPIQIFFSKQSTISHPDVGEFSLEQMADFISAVETSEGDWNCDFDLFLSAAGVVCSADWDHYDISPSEYAVKNLSDMVKDRESFELLQQKVEEWGDYITFLLLNETSFSLYNLRYVEYEGTYRDEEDYVDEIIENYICEKLPSFVEIDYKATARNLLLDSMGSIETSEGLIVYRHT